MVEHFENAYTLFTLEKLLILLVLLTIRIPLLNSKSKKSKTVALLCSPCSVTMFKQSLLAKGTVISSVSILKYLNTHSVTDLLKTGLNTLPIQLTLMHGTMQPNSL